MLFISFHLPLNTVSLSPPQFLLIVPFSVWVFMLKDISSWTPSFLPMSSNAYCFICMLRFLLLLFWKQSNQCFHKLENTGAYVLVIRVIVGVFNYKNDCKVVFELSKKACTHSVGLLLIYLLYYLKQHVVCIYLFLVLLQGVEEWRKGGNVRKD